jgi:hypothetical protein
MQAERNIENTELSDKSIRIEFHANDSILTAESALRPLAGTMTSV